MPAATTEENTFDRNESEQQLLDNVRLSGSARYVIAASAAATALAIGFLAYRARRETRKLRCEKLAAIVDSERQHRLLVNHAADIITVFDATGVVTFVSDATTRLTGFEPHEVIGRNTIEDFVHPEDRDRVRAEFRAGVEKANLTASVQYRHRHKNGGWMVFESTGSNLLHDPNVRGVIVNSRDITEYSEKKRLLAESEERFRLAARATNDAVWDWNLETDEVWHAENYSRLFGYEPEHVLPTIEWWFDAIHPEDRERVRAKIYQTIEGEQEFWRDEYRFARSVRGAAIASGEQIETTKYCAVSDRGFLVRDKNGTAVRFIGAVSDISERTVAEQTRARLASIIESSPDAIKMLDRDGNILSCNQGAQRMYGYTEAELIGKHCELFLPHENRCESAKMFGEILDRVFAGETIADLEMLARRKDDSLIEIAATFSPIKNTAGEVIGIAAVNRDLTARKQTEAALRETQEQLRQAQKMEAIGRLAGGVAHDFNNILAIIIGYAEAALRKLNQDDPTRRRLETIKSAAERAAALTRQLLAFSRRQVLQPQVLNLNQTIEFMREMLEPIVGAQIRLEINLNPNVWLVFADAGQIEQVILNLVANARDAMPGGGTIKITTENATIDNSDIKDFQASEVRLGDYAKLTISDTGAGINDAIKSQVFEPFFTTKPIGKGTGLGLATVYGIVQQSSGFIRVESEANRGASFIVYLPRASGENRAHNRGATENVDLSHHAARGEIVLLVEDEAVLREVVADALRETGYTVLTAANGAEAVRQVSENPRIALVLTDVQMPEMNGRELISRLRLTHPQLRVLLMSGYAADLHARQTEPALQVIQKPFAVNDLLRRVREVLDGSEKRAT